MTDTTAAKSGFGFLGDSNILFWVLIIIVLCGGIGPLGNIFGGFGSDNSLFIILLVILLCSGGFPFLNLW
ncbi:hypothetical protein [Geosporobacter ferrireducens]|uniref:Uncharacterized protein n=1 Tax=Geosporobacter ferrireducens TaxID=1424294 RepID=A0A1D8GHE6_9FIRM|nr:hypothetical protein [Geosporobacter ferrireducens]AOT70310.1 hypothetical protein Gferi_12340 [Geosporobacter ferrireducens]MTI54278.1 hypothetical protein [Geosporobacter ferrireducens]